MSNLRLCNEHIDLARTQAEEYLGRLGTEHTAALQILLSLEEILLNYQAQLGEQAEFSIRCYNRLGQSRIELAIPSKQPMPFSADEDSEILGRLLPQMSLSPSWRFSAGKNIILFTPARKPRSQQFFVVSSLILSAVLGVLFRLAAPELGHLIYDRFLSTILSSVTGLLSFISGPVIFLSVCWGIYGIGDVSTLNRIGKQMLRHFIGMLLLIGICGIALEMPFHSLSMDGEGARIDLAAISALVLDAIPHNLVQPFETNNPMQIIFVAALTGMGLLVLGQKADSVAGLVEQGNRLVMLIMDWFTRLIPIIIFCCCFGMALDIQPSQLAAVGRFAAIHLVSTVLLTLGAFGVTVIRHHISPRVLLHKVLPTFLIGLTTASSTAAFSKNISQCRKLGIDKSLVNFSVPLGQVIYMPTAMLLYIDICFNMAAMYAIPITPLYLFNALLLSILLSIAIPPIPGADVTIFALLFTQMGIPASALAVLLPINMILDFTDTALNLICLQCELVQVAAGADMLDRDRMRAE